MCDVDFDEPLFFVAERATTIFVSCFGGFVLSPTNSHKPSDFVFRRLDVVNAVADV